MTFCFVFKFVRHILLCRTYCVLFSFVSHISTPVRHIEHTNQTAEVETGVGRTGPLSVQRGVRQGCPLSTMLFNLYIELIMRHALEKLEDGIEIRGNLQQLVNDVGKASEPFGLSWKAKKTQVMVIGRHTCSIDLMYNGAPLEQVKQFIYLGASFNEK